MNEWVSASLVLQWFSRVAVQIFFKFFLFLHAIWYLTLYRKYKKYILKITEKKKTNKQTIYLIVAKKQTNNKTTTTTTTQINK